MSKNKLMAAAVLFATLPGMKLFQSGQLEGRKIRLPVQLIRVKSEEPDEEIKAFYGKLLSIVKQDVFHVGEWRLKDVFSFMNDSFLNIMSCTWESPQQLKLVVINLTRNLSQGRIPLTSELDTDGDYLLTDELNGQEYVRKGTDMATTGLHVILDGYKSHIFDISRK